MVRERFDWQIQSEDMAGWSENRRFRRAFCRWGWVGFGFVGVLGGFFGGWFNLLGFAILSDEVEVVSKNFGSKNMDKKALNNIGIAFCIA